MNQNQQTITDLFRRADVLLFKEKSYHEAENLYRQILSIEKSTADMEKNDRNCIDALTSIGYCIKFRTSLKDMLNDNEIEEGYASQPSSMLLGASKRGEGLKKVVGVFTQLVQIYNQALQYDKDDVEANFNLAGLYLQRKEFDLALKHFKDSVNKNEQKGYPEVRALFARQFAKAYFNIGLIYDHIGDVQNAAENYDKSYSKFLEITRGHHPDQPPAPADLSDPANQPTFLKVCTNFASCLEKRGQEGDRKRALEVLSKLQSMHDVEGQDAKLRFNNNLGILHHRSGNLDRAQEYLKKASRQEYQDKFHEFAVNFNLGIIMMQKNNFVEAEEYLKKAQSQIPDRSGVRLEVQAGENDQEVNVLVNLALIYVSQKRLQEALECITTAEKLAPANSKIKSLSTHIKQQLNPDAGGFASSPSLTKGQKKIINNHPNAESISNHHSRKSSMVAKEPSSQKSGSQRGSPAKGVGLDDDDEAEGKDQDGDEERLNQLDNLNIDLHHQIELTKEEEQNNAENEDELNQPDQQTSSLIQQDAGKEAGKSRRNLDPISMDNIREPSPDILLGRQSDYPGEHQLSKSNINQPQQEWKSWTEAQCQGILQKDEEDPVKIQRARFRLAEIYQNQQEFQKAVEQYTACLQIIDNQSNPFLQEKTLMRLAECCYRIEKIPEGVQYLDQLEQQIKPKKIYTVSLLKGKYKDLAKFFGAAAELYQQSLDIYKSEQKSDQQDATIIGNIEFRLGWALIRSRLDIDKGIQTLASANINLKDNVDLKIKLGQILFQEKQDTKRGMEVIEEALERQPENVEALLLHGKMLVKDKQGQKAVDVLEKALLLQVKNQKERPKSSTFFYLGQAYELLREYKKCLLNYKKCLQIDQNHFGASIYLANLLANLAEGQRAVKYFKHALKIDPNSINANFGMAKALQQYSEDKDAPIPHFLLVIEKDPENFKAHTQLGILYLDREEFEKSTHHLKKALSINKQFPLALLSMGNLLFETNHPEDAIRFHKHALKYNPKELQALIGLGNAYYDMQNPKDSIKYYKKAIEIDANLSDVHYNLGNALYLVEKIEDAIHHYQRAIKLNPKKPESFYNLGNALCVKSEYQGAIDSYQSALELDPKNAPALYNLGNALYMMNKYEEAILSYQKALQINDSSPECHFNLASAYNDLKDLPYALHHYQRAIELDEDNVDAYICIGNIYEQYEKFDKAKQAYEQAHRIQPDNAKVVEALEKLAEHRPKKGTNAN